MDRKRRNLSGSHCRGERRTNPANQCPKIPPKSLILRKATASVPHGGGQRFKKESQGISVAAQVDSVMARHTDLENDRENEVTELEVFPPVVTLEECAKHRLAGHGAFRRWPCRRFLPPGPLYLQRQRDRQGRCVRLDSPGRLGETAILVGRPAAPSPRRSGSSGTACRNTRLFRETTTSMSSSWTSCENSASSRLNSRATASFCDVSVSTSPELFLRPDRVQEFLASKDPRKREKAHRHSDRFAGVHGLLDVSASMTIPRRRLFQRHPA